MSTLRFKAVKEAYNRKAVIVDEPLERPSEYYSRNVFNREKMFKYLPKKTYDALVNAIDNGTPLSRDLADSVAARNEKMGVGNGSDSLYSLVSSVDRWYG